MLNSDLTPISETKSIVINGKTYNIRVIKTGRVCVCNIKLDNVEFNGSPIDAYTDPLPEEFCPSIGCAAALSILGGTASMEVIVYTDGKINLWSKEYKGSGTYSVRGSVSWVV